VKNIKYYAFPSSVEEAVSVLLDGEHKAAAVAGGTIIGKSFPSSAETFLDLRNLPLKEIKKDGVYLRIGSGATFDDIDKDAICRSAFGGIISETASKISTQLIRNMGTIGGNIAVPHLYNLFPVLLLGMDAETVLETGEGEITVPFETLRSHKELKPGFNCLIKAVLIPLEAENRKNEFIKLSRTNSSWESYINLFFSSWENGARIAVGTVKPVAFRAEAAEKAVASKRSPAECALTLREELKAAKANTYCCEAAANLLERFLGGDR